MVYKKPIDLNISDINLLTNNKQAFHSYVNRMTKAKPNMVFVPRDGARIIDWYSNLVQTNLSAKRHAPLIEYELKALNQWYGPQGQGHTSEQIEPILREYYSNVDKLVPTQFPDGVRILTNNLQAAGVERGSLTFLQAQEVIPTVSRSTAAGITTFGKKNDPQVLHDALRSRKNMFELTPALVDYRHMRNKLRTIFMDDFGNVITGAQILSPLYDAMGKLEQGTNMWKGFHYFERYISDKFDHTTLVGELDADSMDQWVTRSNVRAYVEPVMLWAYADEYHDAIKAYLDALFYQPAILGDRYFTGEHSIFSGVYPTQLFETIIMLVVVYQLLHDTKYKGKRLLDSAVLEAIGDDVLLLLRLPGDKLIKHRFSNVYGSNTLDQLMARYLTFAGLKNNISKQRVAVGNFFYCRRWYSWSLGTYSNVYGYETVRSAPPMFLRLNSMFNPEYGGGQTPEENFIRDLSILDDALGHPLLNTVIAKLQSEGLLSVPTNVDSVVANYNKRVVNDWKTRTYGDFVLPSSYTWNVLNSVSDIYVDSKKAFI